jgi:hypothetical protein
MKSITIRHRGKIVFKVIHRKSGRYDIIRDKDFADPDVEIEIRDERNCKVLFDRVKQ